MKGVKSMSLFYTYTCLVHFMDILLVSDVQQFLIKMFHLLYSMHHPFPFIFRSLILYYSHHHKQHGLETQAYVDIPLFHMLLNQFLTLIKFHCNVYLLIP